MPEIVEGILVAVLLFFLILHLGAVVEELIVLHLVIVIGLPIFLVEDGGVVFLLQFLGHRALL